jgi:hypothetical protein
MANYSPTKIAALGDIGTGIHVQTGSLAAATYFITGGTQTEIFNVVGRVLVTQLFLEVETVCSANATQVLFNCTFTTPSIGVNAMCAKCASLSGAAAGLRVVWVGAAVATAAVITDSAGLSDVVCNSPHIVGGVTSTPANFVGTLGILVTDATQTSGAYRGHVFYFPMSDGAYISAKL